VVVFFAKHGVLRVNAQKPINCISSVGWHELSVENSGLRQEKACMLKLASHRRWYDSIVIYGLTTFQFYLNDTIKTSVWSAVKDGISFSTLNLDCVILESLKKQVCQSG